jgi:hypothetical protein
VACCDQPFGGTLLCPAEGGCPEDARQWDRGFGFHYTPESHQDDFKKMTSRERRWNDVDAAAVVFSNNQWTSTQPSPFRNEDVIVLNVLWTRKSEMPTGVVFWVGQFGLRLMSSL